MGVCGTYSYTNVKSDDTTSPAFISLDSATQTFTIDSSDINDRGTHLIKVFGQSDSYPTKTSESPVFTLTV